MDTTSAANTLWHAVRFCGCIVCSKKTLEKTVVALPGTEHLAYLAAQGGSRGTHEERRLKGCLDGLR
jgi:hypothetical protein